MMYEQHRCSIEHLRRKAVMEKMGKTAEGDECEVDLDKFVTVDEVGEEDDDDDDENDAMDVTMEKLGAGGGAGTDDEENIEIENDEEINVGSEHIKKHEVYHCDLCYLYISHRGDIDVNLKRHCASAQHLKLYIRYKDDLMLKEEAAELHKKREAEKKKKEKEAAEKKAKEEAEKAAAEAAAAAEEEETAKKETAEEGDEDDEKKEELNGSKADESEIWAELDQNIGELIHDDDESKDDEADDR